MADKDFVVKNGIVVNTSFSANSSSIRLGLTSTNTVINTSTISIGGTVVANSSGAINSGYQTTAGLSANVATLTANNATNLGGTAAAVYVQNTDSRTLSGNLNFTGANVVFSGDNFKFSPASISIISANSTQIVLNAASFSVNGKTIQNFNANVQIKTSSYALVNSDSGSIVEMNSSANLTVTLPNTAPVGFNITVTRIGAGNVSFSNAAGSTLKKKSTGANLYSQYSICTAYVRQNTGNTAADWVLSGDLL